MIRISSLYGLAAVLMGCSWLAAQSTTQGSPSPDERPNIVLIMVDDMGFSDLGCYGGEIETPNLDRIASQGVRFTQFYNCAKCETTRATLLSGRYYPEVKRSKLENCVTIAEGLKLAGYSTMMTGKWHLEGSPMDRGWDQYFGHLSGATNFFTGDETFRLGREKYTVPEQGFYTTDANTDFAIKFLEQTPKDKPFFLYIAHNAPHYPLHAPEKDVRKYLGKYMDGWDTMRSRRLARQKQLGIMSPSVQPAPRPKDVPAWDSLTTKQQRHQDLMMATYAGMIDRVDQNTGRLIEHLQKTNRWENTLFLFLSDNGACPFQRSKKETINQQLKPWDSDSFWTYDKGWAHANNTPFREYKQNQHEGGITTPLIVHWPNGIRNPGSITEQPGHLVDIMATCLDVADSSYPAEYQGQPVGPPRGLSLKPILEGQTRTPHEAIYFSFYGKNNAIRIGDWKLVNKNFGEFELYDLKRDRTELRDLAAENPVKLKEMRQRWDQLSTKVGQTHKPKPTRRKRNPK